MYNIMNHDEDDASPSRSKILDLAPISPLTTNPKTMKASLALFATIAARATAFTPSAHVGRRSMSANSVPLANGAMSFDRVCREWRCKYEGDKATSESLEAISKVVDEFLPQIKAISSGVTVNRLVCGGCLDFKLMTTVSSDADDLSLCITK
jgi:hypothetical protein